MLTFRASLVALTLAACGGAKYPKGTTTPKGSDGLAVKGGIENARLPYQLLEARTGRSVDEPARYARFATGRVVAHASLDWHDRADPWPPTCDWLRAILAARPPRF